jgi:ribosomal protein S18 acetylase RimI-like enzyme
LAPEVRPMSLEDKAAVMDILQHTSEFKPMEVDVAEELIDAYLEEGMASEYYTYVCLVNGLVLGYICYGPTPITEGTYDVYWMAVSLQAQRQGVGHALLTAAEADVRARHGRIILIETSGKASYFKAQHFYASMGYDMVSRIPEFYEPGDDKLTFYKRIS